MSAKAADSIAVSNGGTVSLACFSDRPAIKALMHSRFASRKQDGVSVVRTVRFPVTSDLNHQERAYGDLPRVLSVLFGSSKPTMFAFGWQYFQGPAAAC